MLHRTEGIHIIAHTQHRGASTLCQRHGVESHTDTVHPPRPAEDRALAHFTPSGPHGQHRIEDGIHLGHPLPSHAAGSRHGHHEAPGTRPHVHQLALAAADEPAFYASEGQFPAVGEASYGDIRHPRGLQCSSTIAMNIGCAHNPSR